MKKAWIAAVIIAISGTAFAENSGHEVTVKAVNAEGVLAKLDACLEREPVERNFIKLCMMAATSFIEVQTYDVAKPKEMVNE